MYAIETKAASKPGGRRAEVNYDGKKVLVDGHTPDPDPVAQAAACADRVAEIIRRMTGHSDVMVRPVVLYPNWWVASSVRNPRVWVDNEKAFLTRVKKEPPRLKSEDVALYADRIATSARDRE